MSKDKTIACTSTLCRLTTLGFNKDEGAEDQDPKTYNNKRKTILRKTMEDSQFYHLLMIKNHRQTTATMVQVLCESYDAKKRVFNINNNTTIKFCVEEVAELLGIPNTGSDPLLLCRFSKEKEVLKLPTSFPDYVYELKNKYADKLMSREKTSKSDAGKWGVNWERSKRHLSTGSLVSILKKMEPNNTESRMQYRRLLSYYLVETFLLPSTDEQFCRTSFYKCVEDLERFEATNWAKATLDGIHEAASKIKNGLNTFRGCTPVLRH
ncbi:uncharacterized protein [Spinacia oleracea]|uniref:Aminotransferase-like plant mobile domain-containing protein n=1 Tax=Spinacia oleracea TaxID=3562 RepID=A0ABM3QWH0_SPIOL|nr:uncharacterized protein LOC130462800 [Spinacia oleracea]XP_056687696.1 uncharacterized protein LOC130462800 [Spinacia oleracea]XP_056687697.1 uncharacterized protein LOC130462800 [Spinacia oleracea]